MIPGGGAARMAVAAGMSCLAEASGSVAVVLLLPCPLVVALLGCRQSCLVAASRSAAVMWWDPGPRPAELSTPGRCGRSGCCRAPRRRRRSDVDSRRQVPFGRGECGGTQGCVRGVERPMGGGHGGAVPVVTPGRGVAWVSAVPTTLLIAASSSAAGPGLRPVGLSDLRRWGRGGADLAAPPAVSRGPLELSNPPWGPRPCQSCRGPARAVVQMPAAADRSRLIAASRVVALAWAVGRDSCVAAGITASR